MIPEIASKSGVPPDFVIDVFGALGRGDPSKAKLLCDGPWAGECDGIHPNDSGFKIIAQTIS